MSQDQNSPGILPSSYLCSAPFQENMLAGLVFFFFDDLIPHLRYIIKFFIFACFHDYQRVFSQYIWISYWPLSKAGEELSAVGFACPFGLYCFLPSDDTRDALTCSYSDVDGWQVTFYICLRAAISSLFSVFDPMVMRKEFWQSWTFVRLRTMIPRLTK